jgi:hypothetical protein
MNYIKEAENVLWYYNDLYRSIENMNREIAKIVSRQGPSTLNAISLEQTGVRGGGSADDNVNNLMFKLKTLTENRERTIAELEKVDAIFDDIKKEPGCELYGEVLREWYIYRAPKEEIARQIGYSPTSRTSIYDIRSRAIRKFAVRYFGIEALKGI